MSDIGTSGSFNFAQSGSKALNVTQTARGLFNKISLQGAQSVNVLHIIFQEMLDNQSADILAQAVNAKQIGKDDARLHENIRKDFWMVIPTVKGETYDPDVHDDLIPPKRMFAEIFNRYKRFMIKVLFTTQLQTQNKESFSLYV